MGPNLDRAPTRTGPQPGPGHCTFTLRQFSVVYGYSSLYFRITLNNPAVAMKRENPINQWFVTLRAKGMHNAFVQFPPVLFKSAPPNYAANFAVLGRMDSATIVPWNFAHGHTTTAKPSEVYIFFRTEQLNSVLGFVQVQSPAGFKFDTGLNGGCIAADLPDSYYALRKPGNDTARLPGIVGCNYRIDPFNRAEVKLEGMLKGVHWYGFSLSSSLTSSWPASH